MLKGERGEGSEERFYTPEGKAETAVNKCSMLQREREREIEIDILFIYRPWPNMKGCTYNLIQLNTT